MLFWYPANHVDQEVPCSDFLFNSFEVVEVGSVYEIDHIHLPPRTPLQLRSIRVAMVSEKTELNVAVRYPSMESLKTYFSNSIREMYPALDEKFVMGTALAAKVLIRQVPSQEFAEIKHLEGFWLVNAATAGDDLSEEGNYCSRKGNCLTELKGMGLVSWGIRRQVKFLERHKENINANVQSSSSFSKGSKKMTINEVIRKPEEETEDDDDEEEEDEDEKDVEEEEDGVDDVDEREDQDNEEETEADEEETKEMNRNLKRKRYKLRNSTIRQKAKKVKREKKKKQKKIHGKISQRNKCRDLLVMENPKDRWSAERYQLATKNLLAVMKAKGARAGNPILRPELRVEARKRIGDTGLLDHLLKHMAGKLAPGGEERFRRRHNADGAMEYWLESADLVNIRKEAGVNDPYWIPPPGWKPGDCPTQDPICAKELKFLKGEISHLKRNANEMVSIKQFEEEVGKLRREIDKLASNKRQTENQDSRISSNSCDNISEKLDQLANSLVSSKSDLAKVPVSMEKYKDQLMVIQDFARGIEEEIKKLMGEAAEGISARSNSALIVSKEKSGAEKEIIEVEQGKKGQEVQEVVNVGEEGGSEKAEKAAAAAADTAEKKAAKIERLKSGFRICKPQGTFLWPNMARNNNMVVSPHQVAVQQLVEDLFVVPTPPSVSSSTALAPPQLPAASPPVKKPMAERRAVTALTVSTLSSNDQQINADHSYSSIISTSKKATPINLNDIPPPAQLVLSCTNPSSVVTTTVIPPDQLVLPGGLVGSDNINAGKEAIMGNLQKQPTSKCCSSSSASSCLSWEKVMGNWLALATANSASDDSTSQG
ncbi:hypothetical protein ACH5RR_019550 [Cinchona calisaya]|uniref:PTC1-like winged helix-turn-helix domain-containing protein n=1 Tax=Cinchona calisaya TaxID=153742 RepID=A0ABD2ZPQ2_9GENT